MSKTSSLKEVLQPIYQDIKIENMANIEYVDVTKDDLLKMLQAAVDETISIKELQDWANLVLFNERYVFDGEVLRDVLDRIEESDEPEYELDINELKVLINRLQ